MNESGVWQTLKKGLSNFNCHCTRIESSAGNGVPDVSFGCPGINGWIELKYIAEWPKRETTLLKLPLRPEQKLWIKTRGELSGDVWVFIRIEDNFFLLDWVYAIEACNGWTKEQWCSSKVMHWNKKVNWQEFYDCLEGGC